MSQPFSFEEIKNINNYTIKKPEIIKTHDGINLAYYTFLPECPKAIIIFYHGGGMYINKTYQWVAKELQEKYNIGSFMMDIRGHGNSQGKRGDAPKTESVFCDIDTIIDYVKTKFPDKPIYLCGHSSGAGLLLNYNSWKLRYGLNKSIKGYIFLAPFLGPNSGANKEHKNPKESFIKKARIWVYIINHISKGLLFNHTPAIFFNYPDELLKSDPLILKYYTTAMSKATSPYNPKLAFENINIPFAIYIGQKDEQFIPEKVIEYKNYATKSNINIAKIIPDLKHLSILIEAPKLINEAIINFEKIS